MVYLQLWNKTENAIYPKNVPATLGMISGPQKQCATLEREIFSIDYSWSLRHKENPGQ